MSNIIKGIRTLRGYTQEAVSNAIGMTQRTYCRKEANPDLFTIGEIRRLSIFLGVSEDMLFKKELTVSVT